MEAVEARTYQRRDEACRILDVVYPLLTKMDRNDAMFVIDIQKKRKLHGLKFCPSERTLAWLIDIEDRYVDFESGQVENNS